jgi:Tetratricopeptide repeat
MKIKVCLTVLMFYSISICAKNLSSDEVLKYQRAIEFAGKEYGTSSNQVANATYNLAEAYASNWQETKAEPMYVSAISIFEKNLEPDMLKLGKSYKALATIYNNKKLFEDSEKLFLKAILLFEKKFDLSNSDLMSSYGKLSSVYEAQNKYAESESIHKKIIAFDEMRKDSKELEGDYFSLTNLYRKWCINAQHCEYVEMEYPVRKSISILEPKVDSYTYQVLADQYGYLATLLMVQKKHDDAESVYKKSLYFYELFEKDLGNKTLYTAILHNNLATVNKSQTRVTDAETQFKQSMAIVRMLKNTLIKEGNFKQAIPLIKNYADFLREQNRTDESLALLKENEL